VNDCAVPREALPTEWDQAGLLSIVVQGPLLRDNLVQTATHCRHWRDLFPAAELILAISMTDILRDAAPGRVMTAIHSVAALSDNGTVVAALATLVAVCDRICLADPQLPLPPIKSDTAAPNNVNFQIAAAQAGLALASSSFVLRVRSDLIFLDRSFLDQYADAERVPRGGSAVLSRRVLISWLFTLNPFTVERLPLHFSDWFHFGLTEDVRRLWAVPFVMLRDAVHYRAHRFAPDSNDAERLFNTRIAVEQHLALHAFHDRFPDLRLDYHNDPNAIDRSLSILVDNYALCDLERARCVFEKYGTEFASPGKRVHCLTPSDWLALAHGGDTDPRQILASKIEAFETGAVFPTPTELPWTVPAAALIGKQATLTNGELVARAREGEMFKTPAFVLPAGCYQARLLVTAIAGDGSLMLRVAGRSLVAERITLIEGGSAEITLAFDVSGAAVDLVITCQFLGLRTFVVAGLVVEARRGSPAPQHQQVMPQRFGPNRLRTKIGVHADGQIVATGRDGRLFYGPYTWIAPGRYTARVDTGALDGIGTATLKVTQDAGATTLARKRISIGSTPPPLMIDFDVSGRSAERLEVVCDVSGLHRVAVTGLEIVERTGRPQLWPDRLLQRARNQLRG